MRIILLIALAALVFFPQLVTADPLSDSRSKAESTYPDLGDPKSVFALAYASEESSLRKSQPAFFNDENWPLMLAFRVASKLGMTGANSNTSAPNTAENLNSPKDEKEDAESLYKLGSAYANGEGVPRDYGEAVKWYRKAAEKGHVKASADLGFLYFSGEGIAKDYQQAFKYFLIAAKNNDPTCQRIIGYMYERAIGIEKSDVEARKWYAVAADQGDDVAQTNLGAMYYDGRGGAVNKISAAQLFKKAAEQGNADAQTTLGAMYFSGEGGLPQSDQNAVKWWKNAADQGASGAEFQLGSAIYYGIGISRNEDEGLRLIEKAASSGNTYAVDFLQKLKSSTPRNPSPNQQNAMSLAERTRIERALYAAGLTRHQSDGRKMTDNELRSLYPQALQIIETRKLQK